ncbi:MAG: RNA pyrophosphohydrolase [Alphaproteobacteria bacterium]|nr:RNA pyrophosphohydrolase [Alphaproteobacteria bacterium]
MTKIDRSALKYRPCVGIALFNNFDHVFVGERIDTPNAWQMPQGGIDVGETVKEAATRELTEELGTNKAEIIKIYEKTIKYDLPDNLISKLWNGEYRGQEQHWVAMRFTGQDSDININRFDPPEFRNWKWVEMEKTLDMIVPFKREVYEQVINMFDPKNL